MGKADSTSPSKEDNGAWNAFMALLAAASIGLVFWFTIQEPTGRLRTWAFIADGLVVLTFLGDWLWQFAKAPRKARFLMREWWHLLGMVPLVFTQIAFLRVFRFIELGRVVWASRRLHLQVRRWSEIAKASQIYNLALISSTITLAGSWLVWLVERGTNPRFVDYGEALWWAVVTVTTVGYGDITPETPLGRSVAAILMITGIGTIGLLASTVANAVMERSRLRKGPSAGNTGTMVAEQLERLARLHAEGSLNDDEFKQAKASVLRVRDPAGQSR